MSAIVLSMAKLAVWLSVLLSSLSLGAGNVTPSPTETERINSILKIYGQTMAWSQELLMDRIRMEGDSGLMQVRNVFDGTKPWTLNTWSRKNGQAAIHNHANNIRTVGMGEVVVVMNGVQFTTRHNDYRLNKAHSTSANYREVEPVEFPPVPPSVLSKTTIEEQVAEMREYFKAFADQNPRHRDYTPYFKPVLAYMEGMWTVNSDTVEEPFFSDRHKIEAANWYELQQDVSASIWTGKKDTLENLATLPTKIVGVREDGTPIMAQWNYRILTHPISFDIPLNRYRPVDDLSIMMRSYKDIEDYAKTRSARFQLHPSSKDEPFDGVWRTEANTGYVNFIEQIMNEVPGMDNYQGDIRDTSFGAPPLTKPDESGEELNVAYYHRYYSLAQDDASGFSKAARGFADANLYVAQNTQPEVLSIEMEEKGCRQNCQIEEMKVSYAMPLEIVYMTPLNRWNPYNISIDLENRDFPEIDESGKKTRNGKTAERAYNGGSEKHYYVTPAEMFEGQELDKDSADTTPKDALYVLDQNGVARLTVASGTRVFLPNIPGIGNIRTRYPIFSAHQEGSAYYKEFSALKDAVRFGAKYAPMYETPLGGLSTDAPAGSEVFTFALRRGAGRGPHVHTFTLTGNQITAMKYGVGSPGYLVKVETSTTAGHSHTLEVRMKRNTRGVFIWYCGKFKNTCPDGHPTNTDCLDCPIGLLDPK